jgi:predicted DNA-binding transcriptional regulator AlpA
MKNIDLTNLPDFAYLRLDQVLRIVPVSKASWYLGVQSGKYPAAIKLGSRTSVYKLETIKKLLADLGGV